jgi:hypothetical protein
MSDKPEQSQFSSTQLAMAGLCAAVILVVIVIAFALWNSVSG